MACRDSAVEAPDATIIADMLAGLRSHGGHYSRTLDATINNAVDVPVMALEGTRGQLGLSALRARIRIMVAAMAHLIGWMTMVEVEEP